MVVYLICYGAGMLFASSAHSCLSGISLMFAAVWLYWQDYRKSGNPLHLRGLFSAFWVGGQGVSCLKLSRLQTAWEWQTWACFFVAFTAFWTVFELASRHLFNTRSSFSLGETNYMRYVRQVRGREKGIRYQNAMFESLMILTAVSFGAFVFEAAVLGYVPFFLRGVPHAYSYFHISGVHYFTVSCVLAPSLAVLLFFYDRRMGVGKRMAVLAAAGISLLIPILCVSRFQLILAVFLAIITVMLASGIMKLWYLIAAAAALIPVYVVLTIARSHDVTYLNGIFEMKNPATPIFITQPYMYIANNYDNFNCLVKELPSYALGMKGLFPLWALTGLKFFKPEFVDYPIFTTKEELTTVTLFYDAYYDFGIAGVFFFAAALGIFAAWLMRKIQNSSHPCWYLFYSQAAVYFIFSFFTTWYSNPATWFYFAVTGAIAVYMELRTCQKHYGGSSVWYRKK